MKETYTTVRMHHCRLGEQLSESQIPKNTIDSENKTLYIEVMTSSDKESANKERQFRPIPASCRCKKMVTKREAEDETNYGSSKPVSKRKGDGFETVDDAIWTNFWTDEKAKVPRIDLITRTDIERALLKRKESIRMIDEIHLMFLANRAKLIVPFKHDPTALSCEHPDKVDADRCRKCADTPNRVLFPFAADQRHQNSA